MTVRVGTSIHNTVLPRDMEMSKAGSKFVSFASKLCVLLTYLLVVAAKTTGWVLLLGFGSMFLYRVCRKVWPSIRAKLPSEISAKVGGSPSSKRSSPPPNSKYLVEDFDGEDEITVRHASL